MDHSARFPASVLLLIAAIVLYALFGSPTPDDPGIVEIMLGGLLVLAVGVAGISRTLDWDGGQSHFVLSLQIFFLTGLTLCTIVGVYNGNDHVLIMRDILAFSFLALPLFMAKSFRHSEKATRYFSMALVFAGLCFSLRTVMPVFNIWIPQGELLYLSNSPLALFAALYLAGFAWNCFEDPDVRKLVHAAVSLAGLGLILAAMLLDVQRATIGAVFISLAVLAAFRLVQSPRKALLPVLVFAVLAFIFYPMADDALQAMAHKTAQVGMNMRLQEAEAVFDFLKSSPVSLFFGAGWGGGVRITRRGRSGCKLYPQFADHAGPQGRDRIACSGFARNMYRSISNFSYISTRQGQGALRFLAVRHPDFPLCLS